MKHTRRIGIDLIVPFVLIAVVFGGLFWQKYREATILPDMPPAQQGDAAVRKVILFFADYEGKLVREARETERCNDSADCAHSLLEELFSGPVGDYDDLLPEWSSIRSVSLDAATATIDLDKSFSENIPSGSSSEMLAVYSIVNTICVNLPEIRQVRIMIEGNPKSRLKHLDLSEALEPDYALEVSATQSTEPPAAIKPR